MNDEPCRHEAWEMSGKFWGQRDGLRVETVCPDCPAMGSFLIPEDELVEIIADHMNSYRPEGWTDAE